MFPQELVALRNMTVMNPEIVALGYSFVHNSVTVCAYPPMMVAGRCKFLTVCDDPRMMMVVDRESCRLMVASFFSWYYYYQSNDRYVVCYRKQQKGSLPLLVAASGF